MSFYSLEIDAKFDFFFNLIELSKYEEKHLAFFQALIEKNEKQDPLDELEISKLSLIYHEINHFLDVNTTLWGLEFQIRKQYLVKNSHSKEALQTFHLNTLEISCHDDLLLTRKDSSLTSDYKIAHTLDLTEKFGVTIIILFMKGKDIIHRVPLSMLSLLEASAYSTEMLFKMNHLKENKNVIEQILQQKRLEQEFKNFISDQNLTEYNIFIILVRLFFPEFSLDSSLKLTHNLVKYVLNLGVMTLVQMSDLILESSADKSKAQYLASDLKRGMSRNAVAFKMLIFIRNYIDSHNSQEKDLKLKQLDQDTNTVLDIILKDFLKIKHDLDADEFTIALNHLKGLTQNDHQFSQITASISHNKNQLKDQLLCDIKLSNLKMLDIFLADQSVLKLKNRIEVDIEVYFEEKLKTLSGLEAKLKTSPMTKNLTNVHKS